MLLLIPPKGKHCSHCRVRPHEQPPVYKCIRIILTILLLILMPNSTIVALSLYNFCSATSRCARRWHNSLIRTLFSKYQQHITLFSILIKPLSLTRGKQWLVCNWFWVERKKRRPRFVRHSALNTTRPTWTVYPFDWGGFAVIRVCNFYQLRMPRMYLLSNSSVSLTVQSKFQLYPLDNLQSE